MAHVRDALYMQILAAAAAAAKTMDLPCMCSRGRVCRKNRRREFAVLRSAESVGHSLRTCTWVWLFFFFF